MERPEEEIALRQAILRIANPTRGKRSDRLIAEAVIFGVLGTERQRREYHEAFFNKKPEERLAIAAGLEKLHTAFDRYLDGRSNGERRHFA